MNPIPVTGPRPAWLDTLAPQVAGRSTAWFADFAPPANPPRSSAVLVLVGPSDDPNPGGSGLDVVLTERASSLRSHAAQVAFPGGHADPEDRDVADTALREATEEVGLDRDTVDVVGTLPSVYMSPSRTAVTPVLGWWREPHRIGVVDPGEVAKVVRAPIDDLVDPANRFTVVGPRGYRGAGFAVADLFVWGFTAKLLDVVLEHSGIAPVWDDAVERALPDHLRDAIRGRELPRAGD